MCQPYVGPETLARVSSLEAIHANPHTLRIQMSQENLRAPTQAQALLQLTGIGPA